MNFKKLENNLLDMIQEQQVKIGYMSGVTRFYYPLQSLNRLLGTELTNVSASLCRHRHPIMFTKTGNQVNFWYAL